LPWPEIKWFLKTVGNEGMVKMLSWFENRSARAICCVGWYDGNQVYHVLGICPWNISKEVRGTTNFGRNPIFIPDGYEESFAELPIDIKNQISHRYLAWSQVKKMLYSV
jgi:inosine triphosphate pyrophosphatase